VFCHSDVEQDIRDLPNFTPVEKYASGTPVPGEIGKCENFRFVMHPDLPSRQDAGAAVGTTGLYSTSASNIDVYQIIVIAQDAWSQLVLRGKNSIEPTFLPVGQKSKSDPFGQRGYAGAKWWQAAFIENNGWMAVINVGVKSLTS
jgi:N4-gp56 family major capsid protein